MIKDTTVIIIYPDTKMKVTGLPYKIFKKKKMKKAGITNFLDSLQLI